MSAKENAPAAGNSRGAGSNRAGNFNPEHTPVPVDLHEAGRFLGVFDSEALAFHFRTFPDDGRGAGQNYAGALETVGIDLQLANGNGRGVFAVVNEGGHKDADITRIRAVFADFDGTPMPDQFDLEPHLIIETSAGKFHAYWLVDGLEVDAFKPTQQAIAARYGSDPSVCNPSRVMRLPGFVHRKGDPFQTRIIHESGTLPYTAAEVLAAFPQASKETPRHEHAAGAGERVVSEERHGDLLKLAARFARQVHFDGLGSEAALAALFAEAARGRWTREVPADEIRRAFDGALDKCRRGEWRQADKSDQVDDDDAREPRLTAVDLVAFMHAAAEPPEFVMNPVIPRGVPTLLGAHGGAGKTMLAQIIAAHVACGRSWAGFTVERGAVVFVSLEDRAALMRYRLRKIVECYGLDAEAVASNLQIFDGTDVDGALMTEVNDHGTRALVPTPIMSEVEEAARGATLVIVDNASDGFDGDENNRRQVRAFMRRLSGIAKANNAGMMLLAHIDKAAARFSSHGNSYSGSTAWHNSARSRLAMLADEDGAIELIHEKCNLAKLADPVRLAWSESGVLVPSKADPAAEGASEDAIAKADAEHVLGVVKTAIEAGITVPTAASGPSTSWHALQPLPELGQVYRAKDGKRRVHAALIRLGREGTIVRGTFKTSYRNDRECWLLPDYRTSGENIATKSAAHISPIPPTALPQRRERAAVVPDATTPATPATPADEDCPRCDGEGCKYCVEAVL